MTTESTQPTMSMQFTDEQIAKAVRSLYTNDATAEMARPEDIQTVRAFLAALPAAAVLKNEQSSDALFAPREQLSLEIIKREYFNAGLDKFRVQGGAGDSAQHWRCLQNFAHSIYDSAAPSEQRKPLTDEQVFSALEDEARRLNGGTMDGLQMNPEMLSEVIKIFRIAERAHGIRSTGGDQHG